MGQEITKLKSLQLDESNVTKGLKQNDEDVTGVTLHRTQRSLYAANFKLLLSQIDESDEKDDTDQVFTRFFFEKKFFFFGVSFLVF